MHVIYVICAVLGLLGVILHLWFRPAFHASIVFVNRWATEVLKVETRGLREELRTGSLREGEHSINGQSIFGAIALPSQIEIVWTDAGETDDRRCMISLKGIPLTARNGMLLLQRTSLETWKAEYRPKFDLEELLSYHTR
jgi:hypothetical protein